MYTNILLYKSARYLFLGGVLLLGFGLTYNLGNRVSPPNGGSAYGFASGIFCTVLMVWMALLGVKKRAYRLSLGSLQGWVSAHVYLGVALLVVATLHTGFQFGLNIHTLAYFVLLALVLTGVAGVYGYLRFPRLLSGQTNYFSKQQAIDELHVNAEQAIKLAKNVGPVCETIVRSAIDRTSYGGNFWRQLNCYDNSSMMLPKRFEGAGAVFDRQLVWRLYPNREQLTVRRWLNEQLVHTSQLKNMENLKQLITLFSKRQHTLKQLRQLIRIDLLLNAWRWLHIPLTFVMFATLTAHILSVFLYW